MGWTEAVTKGKDAPDTFPRREGRFRRYKRLTICAVADPPIDQRPPHLQPFRQPPPLPRAGRIQERDGKLYATSPAT
jgi:hypothetical protein